MININTKESIKLTYEKVRIFVIVENTNDLQMYYRLFRLMLKDKIEKEQEIRKDKELLMETDKFKMYFFTGFQHLLGRRTHYVINLTQNKEYHFQCALPTTSHFDYIKDDKKWSELFE
ncbi:hypothetical protein C4A75_09425 [Brevibacillus laterosporus]|nr:hypothetical protein [Brevibacillus laterosporus]PPA84987.1 hypothetical protein C4A75_09425 [Brevibacillus laterosporus]